MKIRNPLDIKMIPEGVSSSVAEWKKDGLDEDQVGSMINDREGLLWRLLLFLLLLLFLRFEHHRYVGIRVNRGFEYSPVARAVYSPPQAEFCTEASTS